MKILKPDHGRRLMLPGVPIPVQRPVDIDRSVTGFSSLRSLRIYRFDAGTTIEGHAEEDEVFVVIMSGSIELTVTNDGSDQESRRFTLSAPRDDEAEPCVAYLPPNAAYGLIAKRDSEVAYARATPADGLPASAFQPSGVTEAIGATVLLDEKTYARRLQLTLINITTEEDAVNYTPMQDSGIDRETLLHIRTTPPDTAAATLGDEIISLASWDTIAAASGEILPTLQIKERSSALVLIVRAI